MSYEKHLQNENCPPGEEVSYDEIEKYLFSVIHQSMGSSTCDAPLISLSIICLNCQNFSFFSFFLALMSSTLFKACLTMLIVAIETSSVRHKIPLVFVQHKVLSLISYVLTTDLSLRFCFSFMCACFAPCARQSLSKHQITPFRWLKTVCAKVWKMSCKRCVPLPHN